MIDSEKAGDKILEIVRSHLDQDYPFPVVSQENCVTIMDDFSEGVW